MGLSWIITFNFHLMKRSNYLHTTIIVLYGSVIDIYISQIYVYNIYICAKKGFQTIQEYRPVYIFSCLFKGKRFPLAVVSFIRFSLVSNHYAEEYK